MSGRGRMAMMRSLVLLVLLLLMLLMEGVLVGEWVSGWWVVADAEGFEGRSTQQ